MSHMDPPPYASSDMAGIVSGATQTATAQMNDKTLQPPLEEETIATNEPAYMQDSKPVLAAGTAEQVEFTTQLTGLDLEEAVWQADPLSTAMTVQTLSDSLVIPASKMGAYMSVSGPEVVGSTAGVVEKQVQGTTMPEKDFNPAPKSFLSPGSVNEDKGPLEVVSDDALSLRSEDKKEENEDPSSAQDNLAECSSSSIDTFEKPVVAACKEDFVSDLAFEGAGHVPVPCITVTDEFGTHSLLVPPDMVDVVPEDGVQLTNPVAEISEDQHASPQEQLLSTSQSPEHDFESAYIQLPSVLVARSPEEPVEMNDASVSNADVAVDEAQHAEVGHGPDSKLLDDLQVERFPMNLDEKLLLSPEGRAATLGNVDDTPKLLQDGDLLLLGSNRDMGREVTRSDSLVLASTTLGPNETAQSNPALVQTDNLLSPLPPIMDHLLLLDDPCTVLSTSTLIPAIYQDLAELTAPTLAPTQRSASSWQPATPSGLGLTLYAEETLVDVVDDPENLAPALPESSHFLDAAITHSPAAPFGTNSAIDDSTTPMPTELQALPEISDTASTAALAPISDTDFALDLVVDSSANGSPDALDHLRIKDDILVDPANLVPAMPDSSTAQLSPEVIPEGSEPCNPSPPSKDEDVARPRKKDDGFDGGRTAQGDASESLAKLADPVECDPASHGRQAELGEDPSVQVREVQDEGPGLGHADEEESPEVAEDATSLILPSSSPPSSQVSDLYHATSVNENAENLAASQEHDHGLMDVMVAKGHDSDDVYPPASSLPSSQPRSSSPAHVFSSPPPDFSSPPSSPQLLPEDKGKDVTEDVQMSYQISCESEDLTPTPKRPAGDNLEDETPDLKRTKSSYTPPPPPNPKRPTVLGQKKQHRKLMQPFRSPLVKIEDILSGKDGVYASGRAHPLPKQIKSEALEDMEWGADSRASGSDETESTTVELIATKNCTANAGKPFKSLLAHSGKTVEKPVTAAGVKTGSTIQALHARVQKLKQAIRIQDEREADGEQRLDMLVSRWRSVGRDVAWLVWDTVKELDPGDSLKPLPMKGGWDEGDVARINKSKGGPGNGGFQSGWGWDGAQSGGAKSGGLESSWGWDDKKDDVVAGEGDESMEIEEPPVQNHSLGTMLRYMGIDPETLGWDEDEGDFVGEP